MPSRPIRTVRGALAFVKDRRILLSTGRSSLPCLAESIAGHGIAGSWMAAPDVHTIYDLLKAVRKGPAVVAAPLVLGKETLLDRSLAPALIRVAADPARRRTAISQLPPLARRLLAQVEAEGEVRMDRLSLPTVRGRRARGILERELLVSSRDFHTERGYHTAVVRPWRAAPMARRFAYHARHLKYEKAVDLLVRAAVQSAVCVPEREARRWFVFGQSRFDALVERGVLARWVSGTTPWLAVGPARLR